MSTPRTVVRLARNASSDCAIDEDELSASGEAIERLLGLKVRRAAHGTAELPGESTFPGLSQLPTLGRSRA